MGGIPPGARRPADQVTVSMAALITRIRNLEARMSGLPLVPMTVAAATTASPNFVRLWTFGGTYPEGWSVSITATPSLSAPATASLELRDATGRVHDFANVTTGLAVTLTADRPNGQVSLFGQVSAAVNLSVGIRDAQTQPWSVLDDT